jgi:TM2 domain-containing membrane protein YozV
MSADRSPKVAALLSAALPGLGQFYNRQWAKGASFVLATVIIDSSLRVTFETMTVLQNAFLRGQGSEVNIGSFLLRMLPLVAIAMWSITDAARTAKASQRPASPVRHLR